MDKIYKTEGKSINYKLIGVGQTIVLLHGFMEDLNMWDTIALSLSKEYQVLLIDLPGHGKSDMLADVHTMDLMADLIHEILSFEKIEKSVLIGHSMGGYVTLAFADKYKNSLSGFGLFHSHSLADDEKAKRNRERTIKIIEDDKGAFIHQFIPSLYAPDNRERLKEEIDHQISLANKMNPKGITAALAGMKLRPMRLDVIVFSEVPILFILGKQDSRNPLEKVMAQAATANTAQINILGNSGHMGWQEETDKSISAIKGFMKLCEV